MSGNILFGRIEVCVNGTWAAVCSDGWNDNEAMVACSQLGYEEGLSL